MKLLISLTFAIVFLSQSAVAADIKKTIFSSTSDADSSRRLVVVQTASPQGMYIFERCSQIVEKEVSTLLDCQTIGSSTGYSKEQLQTRIKKLNKDIYREQIFDGAKIAAGVVAGAGVGLIAGLASMKVIPTPASESDEMGVLGAAIWIGFLGGGAAGGVITYQIVWETDAPAQAELLSVRSQGEAGSTPVLSIQLENINMIDAVQELSITLGGIY